MNSNAMKHFFSSVGLVATCASTSAVAQVGITFNLQLYPQLVQVPGYPVYYAPQLNSNYFFYDGIYWVYAEDNWYASSWYNGPWRLVDPEAVPLYILRVPVRYFRQPPRYFRSWQADAPPRWGDHWGNQWAQHRSGWDHWNHNTVPAPAPLPRYQRQYSGDQYPRAEQQQRLQSQQYHYQAHDPLVRQQVQSRPVQAAAAAAPQDRGRNASGRPDAHDNVHRTAPSPTIQQRAPVQRPDQAQPKREAQGRESETNQRPENDSRQDQGPKDRGQGRNN